MKILCADDDRVSLHLLARLLRGRGHEVTTAADGTEAWERFQEGCYPLVITDWLMPGLDGLELVRRIRARPGRGYAYTILLTTKQAKGDVVAGMEVGADDYLTKPFDANELAARVRAGERIVSLQNRLAEQNEELSLANETMRADLEAAARVQRALLPTEFPSAEGVEFVWRLRPCAELAGDSLNVFALDAHHVGFYLLDVSGHGVSAALMSVALSRLLVPGEKQSSLLTGAAGVPDEERIIAPARVAARLDRRVRSHWSSGQTVSLLYGVLDLRTGTWTYVAAGHPGPVLLRGGEAEVLEATGPAIGAGSEGQFEERTVSLGPGSRLVAYSDGLVDARNADGEAFGSDRLRELLAKGARRPLRQGLPLVIDWVRRWSGRAALEDDASCLALEIGPGPA